MKRTIKLSYIFVISALCFAVISLCLFTNIKNATALNTNSVEVDTDTVTHGVPGVMTVDNEIKTALMPVGKALYVYGGGWNENIDPSREDLRADTGANPETETIGVPKIWSDFFASQNAEYTPWDVPELDFDVNPPCVHWGVDCSGYLGWVLQNITNLPNGFDTNGLNHEGWVTYAQHIGFGLSHLGYGERILCPNPDVADNAEDPYATTNLDGLQNNSTETTNNSNANYSFVPGNIYTFQTGQYHCYLCLGQCLDGSILLVHCSDPGVFICGTSPDYNEDDPLACDSDALKISREYMKRYYSDFYDRYGGPGKPGSIVDGKATNYLKYTEFNWNTSGEHALLDPNGLREKKPSEILKNYIYHEMNANASFNISGPTPVIHFNDALIDSESMSNGAIVYNQESNFDKNIEVSFSIPQGYKFDSIKINDVDYSSQLTEDSNLAKITTPNTNNYKVECVSSLISAPTETAQTSDFSYVLVAVLSFIFITCCVFMFRKD